MEKYLSAKQLAELLGVHKSCIWKWAAQGRLPKGERLGAKCTRWKESDVLKAIEGLKASASIPASAES